MRSHETDEEGNAICYDCKAHVPQHLVEQHDCPPWLKELVLKKRRDGAYVAGIIERTNLNVPIEFRERELNDEL